MSSYFDAAARAMASSPSEVAIATIKNKVIARVSSYLDYLEKNCLKKERSKIPALRATFEKVTTKPREWDKTGEFMVSELHTLAHDIGNARIMIRGGLIAGDNPYFPGHYDREFNQ